MPNSTTTAPVPIWSLVEWAQAIADLPAGGPLPHRTVVVPAEPSAHALRRELCRLGRADALLGTQFVDPVTAAAEVLLRSGVQVTVDEDSLRHARARVLITTDLKLRYFRADRLRSGVGWGEAIAATISRLEAAGFRPEDLAKAIDDSGRLEDIGTFWRLLDEDAATSWTGARVMAEASTLLAASPRLWPFAGPVLAVLEADGIAVTTRFVRCIPQLHLGVVGAKPARQHFLLRSKALLGSDPAMGLPPRDTARELDLVSRLLFEAPGHLADPERQRSSGADGSVTLEEYAGVDEELQAAVDWVGRLVLEKQVPLEQIALLSPTVDPLSGMLMDRLRTLPTCPAVYVAGGLPIAHEAGGARMLSLIRALDDFLEIGALADLLPYLRCCVQPTLAGEAGEQRRLSIGEAALVAGSLGTVGGSFERPGDALQWIVRLDARKAALTRIVAAVVLEKGETESGDPEERAQAELLELLQRVTPALEALSALAGFLVRAESLAVLWPELLRFAEQWLILPADGARIPALLAKLVEPLRADRSLGQLAGRDALQVIQECLMSLRAPTARFGDAAVYVGTIRSAAGLSFKAVRILGLCEGGYPARVREDPVLPARLAASFGPALPSMDDRILSDLHTFGRVVRDTGDELVLSVPRRTLEGTEHEPSFLLLEVAAAMGRPDTVGGKVRHVPIPNGPALRRTCFEPARTFARSSTLESPLTSTALLVRAAMTGEIPASWRTNPALDLGRMRKLASEASSKGFWGPLDGILGDTLPLLVLPGLSAERPISASGLKTFLDCPHRFLYERLLGWNDPPERPSGASAIDARNYGSLFHSVVEHFYRLHGPAFGKREQTLGIWSTRARPIADERYAELLEVYPLASLAVREQERRRLHRDLDTYLRRDWSGGARRYVDVERTFGYDHPFKLRVGRRDLYVRGYIDRLDVEGDTTFIRDVKTGKPVLRSGAQAAPDPSTDLQLGVYALAVQALASEWKVPARVGVAYDYIGRGEGMRAFREDIKDLTSATGEWLATAIGLMAERQFPRTPDTDDCRFCRFSPVCQDSGPARAALMLEQATGALARFRGLKSGGDPS